MSKPSKPQGRRWGPPLMQWFLREYPKFATDDRTPNQWGHVYGFTDADFSRWSDGSVQPSFEKMVKLADAMPAPYSLLDVLVAATLVSPDQVGGHEAIELAAPLTLRDMIRRSALTDGQKAGLIESLDAFDAMNGTST